jgi:hypothetical protein
MPVTSAAETTRRRAGLLEDIVTAAEPAGRTAVTNPLIVMS